MDIVLAIAALIVCSTTEDDEIAVFPKLIWMLFIVFLPLAGAILWFAYGRRRKVHQQWRPGSGFPEHERPRRPLAPDDDPEFLRGIAAAQRESHAADLELMRKWEEDLRRREEQLRRQTQPGTSTD